MPSPLPSPPSPSRRGFLLGAAAGGLLPAIRMPEGEPEDFAAFGRLAGLEFSEEERKQAGERLARQRRQFEDLRAEDVPFELPPCTAFDPVPTGTALPPEGPGAAWSPLEDVAEPADDLALAFASVDELAAMLRAGKVTSRSLTELALARLEKHDPTLHCVVTLLKDEALRAADARDAEIRDGRWRGPLHGIPYAAKDLFAWPGAPTTFGAAPYRDHVWGNVKATVLQKLEDAGAVLVAKTSLGALAMGDVWFGGTTRNPWNPEEGSSGSSAGSAAAVAAGLVPFALGTETLGSIVSPCRQCGVAGLRPTFGTVSRYGAMPLSWTMDKVGPIARTAVDAAIVFETIRGADGRDPSARTAAFAWRRGRGLEGLRIGYLQGERYLRDDDEKAFLDWLRGRGVELSPVTLPDAPYRALRLMLNAEAAAAFDDLTRSGRLPALTRQDDGAWPNSFRASRAIPAVEYLRASRLRTRLLSDMAAALSRIDVLVAPTHGGPLLTCTNLTGHPTYVLPIARGERDNGKPKVLALAGKLYGEADILAVAEHWQASTDHHRHRPPLD